MSSLKGTRKLIWFTYVMPLTLRIILSQTFSNVAELSILSSQLQQEENGIKIFISGN